MSDVLILGCGYTGLRLGRRLLADGHAVTGTTRGEERAARLEEAGIRPLSLDVRREGDLRRLRAEAPEVCFYLIPPVEEGDLAAVVRALRRAPLEAFVYGSSTGVYGDRGGEWVDETSVPEPDSSRGEARLSAERALLRAGWEFDARPRIARIAGIYGPGRCLVDAIASGRYRLVEGVDAWTNRIHVDDLVSGLAAAWRRGDDGRVYNLSDGHPHRSSDFARLVAEMADLTLRTESLEEARERYSPARLARKLGSKKVDNRRLREELEVDLRYPSFREGVPASLEGAVTDPPPSPPG